MKRLIIAVILMLFAIGSSTAEVIYIGNSSDIYIEQIEEIDALMLKNDLASAFRLCVNAEKGWEEKEKNINMFLIHDYVDSVSVSFAKMRAHIENGNPDMYFSESAAAKKALASIKGSEYADFENIL